MTISKKMMFLFLPVALIAASMRAVDSETTSGNNNEKAPVVEQKIVASTDDKNLSETIKKEETKGKETQEITAKANGEEAKKIHDEILVRTSANAFEYALSQYQRYFGKCACDKILDFQVTPFVRYLKNKIDEAKVDTVDFSREYSYRTIGANVQGQLNCGDFWILANATFGSLKQDWKVKAAKEGVTTIATAAAIDSKSFGLEDMKVKLGYNFYCDNAKLAVYLLGDGLFPTDPKTNVVKRIAPVKVDTITLTDNLEYPAPYMGSLNYRLGGGFEGAVNLWECDNSKLAFLFDTYYHYSFARTLTEKFEFKDGDKTVKDVTLKFTPGHTINLFGALHYAYENCHFEVGSVFATTFGESLKASLKNDDKDDAKVISEDNMKKIMNDGFIRTPQTIKFSVQPYVALGYETSICDNPLTLGLGLGYEYDSIRRPESDKNKKALHGVTAWATAALCF